MVGVGTTNVYNVSSHLVSSRKIIGDHMLIGKEMMRMLGQGTNMLSADELPVVGSDGKVDEGLFNRYCRPRLVTEILIS